MPQVRGRGPETEAVRQRLERDFVPVAVDVDQQRALFRRHQGRVVPMTLIQTPGGRTILRFQRTFRDVERTFRDVDAFDALLLTGGGECYMVRLCHGKRVSMSPGALHHIMVRGINKTDIFKDKRDKGPLPGGPLGTLMHLMRYS